MPAVGRLQSATARCGEVLHFSAKYAAIFRRYGRCGGQASVISLPCHFTFKDYSRHYYSAHAALHYALDVGTPRIEFVGRAGTPGADSEMS